MNHTDLRTQLALAMCRPEGTVQFDYTSPEAFSRTGTPGLIQDFVAGQHYFRIERVSPRQLAFYYSSPGTGTRVASINLDSAPDFETAFIAFTWSPADVIFYIGPRSEGASLITAKAVLSPKQFRITTDGQVIQVGDDGIEVMGIHVREAGRTILRPTAKQAWEETKKAIEILKTGTSDQGFVFEMALSAMSIVALVTGFEAYTKTRFNEISTEGLAPNYEALFHAFSTNKQREDGLESIKAKTAARGGGLLESLAASLRVNFQNYEDVKKAYRAAYGIRIPELVDSSTVERLKVLIGYRHRIIHVSPLGMLNPERVPPDAPAMATSHLVEEAVACLDRVIGVLHDTTLSLRP